MSRLDTLPDSVVDAVGEKGPPLPPRLDGALTLLMAAGTGLAIANVYYAQPLLGLMGRDLGDTPTVGLIPTATQLGYAAGILLLVPLSDRMDRRRIILLQCAGLAVALVAAALAPSSVALAVASVAVGAFATIAQQIVPFAAELAEPARRGRAVGRVMSGLLVGILLARTLSGVVGEWQGWRSVFWLAAGLATSTGLLLAWRLPHSRPATDESYSRLLTSLWRLFWGEAELRRAALTQGLLFAAFSAFWTTLVLLLERPRYGLGSDAAGLFGVLAVAGVFIAPLAGRRADSAGPRPIIALGSVIVIVAFALMTLDASLASLGLGVVLMDAGVQMAMIGNQATIYALAGEARGRFNTVFIATMFVLGAAGSATANIAWTTAGWPAVTLLAATFAALAFLLQTISGRARAHMGEPS